MNLSLSSFPSFASVQIHFFLLFATASIFAAETPSPATPKHGGTLRLAIEIDPRSREAAARNVPPAEHPQRWLEPVALPGVKALGRHTVQIQLAKPDPTFLFTLSYGSASIVPRDYIERVGRRFVTAPIGTGP